MTTPESIINAVCAVFGVTTDELRTRRKHRRITDARIAAAYYLRIRGNCLPGDIARLLNQQPGAWPSFAIWRCYDLAVADAKYRERVMAVDKLVMGGAR